MASQKAGSSTHKRESKLLKPYYESETVTIYCGDCQEILPSIGKVGAVVTDPPYSINTKSDLYGKLNPWADMCNGSVFNQSWLGLCKKAIADDGCVWACLSWRSLVSFQKAACDLSWPIESLLAWDKCWIGTGGCRGLRPSYEMVALWAGPEFAIPDRGLPDVQRFKWANGSQVLHPAQKPVALMEWLIDTVPNDGAILDPFMGSGTTLRAAKNLGRRSIGIEMSEHYCRKAVERLRQDCMQFAG